MRRLPNVNDVVSRVTARAISLQKEAEYRPPVDISGKMTVPVATLMAKFAASLRQVDAEEISLQDVKEFVDGVTCR